MYSQPLRSHRLQIFVGVRFDFGPLLEGQTIALTAITLVVLKTNICKVIR